MARWTAESGRHAANVTVESTPPPLLHGMLIQEFLQRLEHVVRKRFIVAVAGNRHETLRLVGRLEQTRAVLVWHHFIGGAVRQKLRPMTICDPGEHVIVGAHYRRD